MSATAPVDLIESRWKLWNLRVDTVLKVVSPVSILFALIVAWQTVSSQLRHSDEYERRKSLLDLRIETTVTSIDDESSVLIVDVKLHNIGKQKIHPYSHADEKGPKFTYEGEGCTLSVTRHDISGEGHVNGSGTRLVPRFNILERYNYDETPWHEAYAIKPDAQYRESESFVVKAGYVYEIVARFYILSEGETSTNTETRFVYVKPGS